MFREHKGVATASIPMEEFDIGDWYHIRASRRDAASRAASYSARVRATRADTDKIASTPDTAWPALQTSRQRFGVASRAPASMSFAMSGPPCAGKASGSRPAATIEGRSMFVSSPVKARVSNMSSARHATNIRLYQPAERKTRGGRAIPKASHP